MLKNFINIPNFILLYYKPDDFMQKLLEVKIKQLKQHHPKSKIHILSSENNTNFSDVIWHNKKLKYSHMAKYEIFDLLDDPAMYLDLDVMIRRPFAYHHLICKSPINLYKKYPSKWGGLQASCCDLKHIKNKLDCYNAGVTWIKEPKPRMKEELLEIYHTLIDTPQNREFLKDKGIAKFVFNSDEHALSWYVHRENYEIKISSEVNVFRYHTSWIDAQSVHYPGNQKKRLSKELHIY